jgi:hypothetical protein
MIIEFKLGFNSLQQIKDNGIKINQIISDRMIMIIKTEAKTIIVALMNQKENKNKYLSQ